VEPPAAGGPGGRAKANDFWRFMSKKLILGAYVGYRPPWIRLCPDLTNLVPITWHQKYTNNLFSCGRSGPILMSLWAGSEIKVISNVSGHLHKNYIISLTRNVFCALRLRFKLAEIVFRCKIAIKNKTFLLTLCVTRVECEPDFMVSIIINQFENTNSGER